MQNVKNIFYKFSLRYALILFQNSLECVWWLQGFATNEPLEKLTLFPKSHNWNKGMNKGMGVEERKRMAKERKETAEEIE